MEVRDARATVEMASTDVMPVQVTHSQEHHCHMVSRFCRITFHQAPTKGIVSVLGMAKASPDCVGESHGGFASDDSDISGFSHMVRSPLAAMR